MSRDPILYLEDIVESCRYILQFTSSLTYEVFRHDRMRIDAVARNFEIIGEAARSLPMDVRNAIPEVAWPDVIGMRNILAHAYFGIDTEIRWSATREKVEPMMNAVSSYIAQHSAR